MLRVVVENRQYPVTLDDLHRIFSKFGYVKKIITFTKNGKKKCCCKSSDRFPIMIYEFRLFRRFLVTFGHSLTYHSTITLFNFERAESEKNHAPLSCFFQYAAECFSGTCAQCVIISVTLTALLQLKSVSLKF